MSIGIVRVNAQSLPVMLHCLLVHSFLRDFARQDYSAHSLKWDRFDDVRPERLSVSPNDALPPCQKCAARP
jgi:hypothetical protein